MYTQTRTFNKKCASSTDGCGRGGLVWYGCLDECMFVRMYACICVYMYTYIHICCGVEVALQYGVYLCVCVCVCVYVCMCDLTHSYMSHSCVWHDSFTCVI